MRETEKEKKEIERKNKKKMLEGATNLHFSPV